MRVSTILSRNSHDDEMFRHRGRRNSGDHSSAQCLEEALLLFGVAHYVFNQKVSRASRSTMWFIVHDIMGLPAESTATADALKNLSVLTA